MLRLVRINRTELVRWSLLAESIQCNVFFAETDLDNMNCYLPKEIASPEVEIKDDSNIRTIVLGLIGLAVLGLLIIGFIGATSKSVEQE